MNNNMKFGFAQYLSRGLDNQSIIIQKLSDESKRFFLNKNYGYGLKSLSIGIICVSKEFEQFFKPKKPKFIKSRVSVIDGLKVEYD